MRVTDGSMADQSPSAQPEGFDQPSSPTVPGMIVLRTATLTNIILLIPIVLRLCAVQVGAGKITVLCAGVYTAQILRKSGSEVEEFFPFSPHLSRSGGSLTAPAAARTIRKNPHWLLNSSQ